MKAMSGHRGAGVLAPGVAGPKCSPGVSLEPGTHLLCC